MKKRSTVLSLLVATAAFVFSGCPKNKNTPPVSDSDLQSANDVLWATQAITDIQMMCAFVGENEFVQHFYTHVPGTAPINRCESSRILEEGRISMNFNETPCLDGRRRSGEVRLVYLPDLSRPNADYYHEYRFSGRLSLIQYWVDGWEITAAEGAVIRNSLASHQWDPRKINLQWTLEGRFAFTNLADPSKRLTWEGKLTKELLNTSDNRVFNTGAMPAITWSLANVGYYGDAAGIAPGNVAYKLSVKSSEKLVRDFTCSPELLGVTLAGSDLRPTPSEFHPFVKGIAMVEPEGKYPRRVYLGNEANPDLATQCDNSGQVLIKGMLYKLDLKK